MCTTVGKKGGKADSDYNITKKKVAGRKNMQKSQIKSGVGRTNCHFGGTKRDSAAACAEEGKGTCLDKQ